MKTNETTTELNQLIDVLAADINSKNYKLQNIFNRHINKIKKINNEGVTYKRMMDLMNMNIENKISHPHCKVLLFRAKKWLN
jgi:hypothetical protein